MNKSFKKISIISLVVITSSIVVFFVIKNLFYSNAQSNTTATTNTTSNEASRDQTTQHHKDLLKIQSDDIMLGDKDAPITIIEYASLSCSHCATFYSDGFSKLKVDYIDTGKVKFIYRDFPLNHPALTASIIALCQVKNIDKDSIKYHNFIKLLFKTQDSWAFDDDFTGKLENIAKLDGMSKQEFNSCLKNNQLQDKILKKRLVATKALQISSTPTFFVNNKIINGFTGYGDIKVIIEEELSNFYIDNSK
jgi:protein-disulfide isomerase